MRVCARIVLSLGVLSACGTDGGLSEPETESGSESSVGTTSPTTGDSAATTTADTGDSGSDADAACRANCEAQFATQCPIHSDLEICVASCGSLLDAQDGLCLDEQLAVLRCSAEGGYECVNDNATERAACPGEKAAFMACFETRGCEGFCRDATMEGCEPDVDACFAACLQQTEGFGKCAPRFDTLRYCQATQPSSVCDPAGYPCDDETVDMAGCIAGETEDLCQGWCFAEDELGCGTASCADDCAAKLADPDCGSDFESVADCGFTFGDLDCIDGRLVGDRDFCHDEQAEYENCLGL